MTREQYIRMTEATRRAADRLPGGARALRAPTLLCAAIYCASLLYLMFTGDGRIVRAVLVPAACFAVVTALRPLLGKQRPYDRYGAPPVGVCMALLCALIGGLRVLSGQHDLSDVLAALALSLALSLAGYLL